MTGRRAALVRVRAAYDEDLAAPEVERRQLALFNAQWSHALEGHRFYRHWRQQHDLPPLVGSMAELTSFPLLRRATIREHQELVFAESSLRRVYTTGGTTAEPALFPRARYERPEQWADNYVGRLWWGLGPADRTVLVWGHSHLFGTGPSRLLRLVDRQLRDLATRTLRLDGYRIDPEALRGQLRAIVRYRPSYLVGYSSSLAALARIAGPDDARRLRELGLKGAVATADSLDESDREAIERVFGCPAIIEYGAAELGVVAISRGRSDRIATLWQSHLVTVHPTHGAVVSTLKRRQFPLIQYCLEDQLEVDTATPGGSVLAVRRIAGRTLDLVRLGVTEGSIEVSALQLTQMIKGHPGVLAVQFSQQSPTRAGVHVHRQPDQTLADIERFLWIQLRRDYPALRADSIVMIDEPRQIRSRAGKHLVVRPGTEDAGRTGS